MIINSKKIELFKNLSQMDIDNVYYDFHNDFNCVKVKYENQILIVIFQSIRSDFLISFKFQNSIIIFYEFDFNGSIQSLTIDNLYRGKFETNGELIEFKNNSGYFYLEFYEGQKIEFWSEQLNVEKELVPIYPKSSV